MAILLIAEHHHTGIKSATLAVLSAALKLGNDIHVLVAGSNCKAAADAVAKLKGVSKILVCDHASYKHFLAENMASLVASIAKNYSHILTPASTFGKDFLPRAAALCDVGQISDVIKIIDSKTYVRPIYAGNALATVQSNDPIQFLTIRPTAFEKAGEGEGAVIEALPSVGGVGRSEFVSEEITKSERPELGSARIVISGGRGLGSAENFKLVEKIAEKLGAAVGASRAAVDAGYVPNDYQVGQTGKVVAPDLYIAVGISGAIQHLAGMKDSKVIVAINKDENAPIFEIADYGLVADLFTALPDLEKLL